MFDAAPMTGPATFRATDPAQAIYRGLLSSLDDTQLATVEEEIGMFARTGLLPRGLARILDAGALLPEAA